MTSGNQTWTGEGAISMGSSWDKDKSKEANRDFGKAESAGAVKVWQKPTRGRRYFEELLEQLAG
jgi:hypothetical protein